MLDGWYLAGVLAVAGGVTLALRAVPFALLRPLRQSRFVQTMAVWMPAGILAILAASTFLGAAGQAPGYGLKAGVAVAVTVGVHLGFGRRTLLSVGLGTLSFVLLVNLM